MAKWDFDKIDAEKAKLIEERDDCMDKLEHALDQRDEADARAEAAEAKLAQAVGVLEWYGEQSRLARLIHSGGDAGRNAISADGGKRARAFLATIQPEGETDDKA